MSVIFNSKENYILEDERVLLRVLRREDEEYLLPFSLNEKDLWNYSLISAATKEGLKNYINPTAKSKAFRISFCQQECNNFWQLNNLQLFFSD